MGNIKNRLNAIGLEAADIMIPRKGVDLDKWAVVACDQFTSEKDYWHDVEDYVGKAPSTLKLIFPECYLEDGDGDSRIEAINRTMKEYVDQDLFTTYPNCFFLVKRSCGSA